MRLTYGQILKLKDYLPFYIYDYKIIKEQVSKLRKYLPPNVKVFYSVKANPNMTVLRIMKNFGFGVEILSSGEMFVSEKAGFRPDEMIFGGSTKSDEELTVALEKNVGLIILESLPEIERLERIARDIGKKPKVIIRLNLQIARRCSTAQENSLSFHGIPVDELKKYYFKKRRIFFNLCLMGFHVYESSRIFNHFVLIKRNRDFFSAVREIEKEFKITAQIIDIGGGFGATIKKELPIANFFRGLKKTMNEYGFHNRAILLELGRYLINPSGTFVSKVIEIRKRDEHNIVVVEGLLNYLYRVLNKANDRSRFMGDMNDYKIKFLPYRRPSKCCPTVIFGQLSSVVDTFGRSFECEFLLPKPRVGDLIVIQGVGAYGLTQALNSFGCRPLGAEFLLIDNKLELIRNKGAITDVLSGQRIPPILNKKI